MKISSSPNSPGRAAGAVIMELLVSCALCTVFFISLAASFRSLALAARNVSESVTRVKIAVRASPLLRNVTEAVDSHRLEVYPRIASGPLAFTTRTLIPTGRQNADESDAIYYIAAQRGTGRIEAKSIEAGSLRADICFDERPAERGGMLDALSITPEGVFEVSVAFEDGSEPCRAGLIRPLRPLITGELAVTKLVTVSVVIPIAERAILYTDADSTLRIIRIFNNETLENQPLLEGIRRIRASESTSPEKLFELHAEMHFGVGKPVSLVARSALSRRGFLNILLNA